MVGPSSEPGSRATASATPHAPEPLDSGAGDARRRRRAFRLPDETGVAISLVALVAFIGVFHPAFAEPDNLLDLVSSASFFGVISLAMVYLLALGEIDLSVGWSFNFAAVIAGKLMIGGLDPWLAALAGIAFGAALGFVNGALAIALRLQVIIVTLGTFSMFHGLSLVVNDQSAVVPENTDSSFFSFATAEPLGIPMPALMLVVLMVVLHLTLHHTRFGYRVLAIGSNPEAARLAGIPIARVKLLALVMLGAVCGLSGVLFLGAQGAVDPSSGGEFMLLVIAAAIIGGTPLSGGSGTVIGAAIGVLIIASIQSGIAFFGVEATWSTFVTGAVIVLAVAIDQFVRWHRRSRAAASAGRAAVGEIPDGSPEPGQ
jgi:ribose transport system permease protein